MTLRAQIGTIVLLFLFALQAPTNSLAQWIKEGGDHSKLTPNIASNEQPQTNFTLTDDVDGQIRTELHVPTAYLDKDSSEAGKAGQYLYLKMIWPSLASTSVRFGTKMSSEEYGDQQQLLHSGQAFKIQLMQGRLSLMKEMIEEHIKNDWHLMPNPKSMPGFTQYISRIDEDEVLNKHWIGSFYLVPTDPNYSTKLYIECPINSPGPTQGLYCEEHTYLNHYVYGQYMFSLAYLSDWQKIDAAVQKLFTDMSEPDSNSNSIRPELGENAIGSKCSKACN